MDQDRRRKHLHGDGEEFSENRSRLFLHLHLPRYPNLHPPHVSPMCLGDRIGFQQTTARNLHRAQRPTGRGNAISRGLLSAAPPGRSHTRIYSYARLFSTLPPPTAWPSLPGACATVACSGTRTPATRCGMNSCVTLRSLRQPGVGISPARDVRILTRFYGPRVTRRLGGSTR